MGLRFYTKLASFIALFLGIMSGLTCFYPALLFYGMLGSILGTLLAVFVIFTRTKYGVPTKWNHISVISIVLCSVPVLYVLLLLFVLKKA